MPKDYFSTDKTTNLADVPKDGKIHIIGVCGVAMAQLAVLLAEQGYRVTGSDREFYDPMKSFLKSSAVKIQEGHSKSNVALDCDHGSNRQCHCL